MTWVKLDDGFAEHPKMLAVGPLGLALHVAALCYCSRHLTDGRLPKAAVPRLLDLPTHRKVAASLVAAGVWLEVDGGYELHDYLDYQASRSEVEAKLAERSRQKSRAGRSGNHKRWHVDRNEPDPECPECIAELSHAAIPLRSQTIAPSHPIPSHEVKDLQQQRRVPERHKAAEAIESAVRVVEHRRGLSDAARGKRSPSAWIASARAGIRGEIEQHPAFNATFGLGGEALADLIEPRPATTRPNEPDPTKPLGAAS